MKKIWLLTTLLVAWLLLTGCNNSSKDGANHTEWKSYSEAVQICEDNDWEVTTDELWNNICLLNALDWCLIEKIQNWTCEYICEWDDCNTPDDFEDCEHYFDWCNRCTLQEDWAFVCTEEACKVYQEAYCWDDLYEKYLEDIKKSWAEPQRINDYPEETGKENILVTTEEPMDVSHVINLKLWDKSFDVTLEDNTATKALLEKLKEWDIVVNAQDYWNFEKVWYLWFKLPTEDINITTQLWDLVLYDWNQISLFYNSNSWSYTKLWKVQKITESDFWDWGVTLVFSLLK